MQNALLAAQVSAALGQWYMWFRVVPRYVHTSEQRSPVLASAWQCELQTDFPTSDG